MRLTKQIFVFCLVAGAFNQPVARGNTRVGSSGGDVLQAALEETRKLLILVLNWIKAGKEIKHEEIVDECGKHRQVTEAQRALCVEFIENTTRAILELNEDPEKATPFEFSARDDLVVDDVDEYGNHIDLSVLAATQPQAEGPITFLKSKVQWLDPAKLLHLMTHEFGHKVKFAAAEHGFISDIEPMHGDKKFRGRALLDTVGAAIVGMAQTRGKLGGAFQVRDNFQCVYFYWMPLDPASFRSYSKTIDGVRQFTRTPDSPYTQYESGFGYIEKKKAWRFQVIKTIDSRMERINVNVRLKVMEPKNCEDDSESKRNRSTTLTITQEDNSGIESPLGQPLHIPEYNPACEEGSKPIDQDLSPDEQNLGPMTIKISPEAILTCSFQESAIN